MSRLRTLLSRLRDEAPFLHGERGGLALTRSLRRAGRGGAKTLSDGEEARGADASGGTFEGLRLPRLEDCRLTGATLTGADLSGGAVVRSHLDGARVGGTAAGTAFEVVDFEGAHIQGLGAADSRWSLCSLRNAVLRSVDLGGAALVLTDFSFADLDGVRFDGARLVGCDFEGARLVRCSFRGADLRGTRFDGCALAEADFEGADVTDADLRRSLGLTEAQRAALAAGGARASRALLPRLWGRVLGEGPESLGRVRTAEAVTWAAILIALPALFFGRAILHPVNPDVPPGSEAQYAEPEDAVEPPERPGAEP